MELWSTYESSLSPSSLCTMTSEYSDVTLPSYANLLDYSPAKVEQPQPTEEILVTRECIFDIKQGLHLTPPCTHFYHPDTIQCPEGLHKLMTFQHGCPQHCKSPGRMCFLHMSTKMSSRHGDHQVSILEQAISSLHDHQP